MIVLERYSLSETETEGKLLCGDFSLYTIEPPWRNNERMKSCVPLGRYEILPFSSPRFGKVWGIENKEYGIILDPAPGESFARSHILIHPANHASQLQGCIAPGLRRECMLDRKLDRFVPSVWASQNAFVKLNSFLTSLPPSSRILDIRLRGIVWTPPKPIKSSGAA